MNGVDTAILVITTLSFLFGLWRGLIKEVLSLLTWVAALIVARLYSETLSELLVNIIDSSSIRYVSAFAIIFIVVMMNPDRHAIFVSSPGVGRFMPRSFSNETFLKTMQNSVL